MLKILFLTDETPSLYLFEIYFQRKEVLVYIEKRIFSISQDFCCRAQINLCVATTPVLPPLKKKKNTPVFP